MTVCSPPTSSPPPHLLLIQRSTSSMSPFSNIPLSSYPLSVFLSDLLATHPFVRIDDYSSSGGGGSGGKPPEAFVRLVQNKIAMGKLKMMQVRIGVYWYYITSTSDALTDRQTSRKRRRSGGEEERLCIVVLSSHLFVLLAVVSFEFTIYALYALCPTYRTLQRFARCSRSKGWLRGVCRTTAKG